MNEHRYRRLAANRRGRGNLVRYDEYKAARWRSYRRFLLAPS